MPHPIRARNLTLLLTTLSFLTLAGCARDAGSSDPRRPGGPAYGFTGGASAVASDPGTLPAGIEGRFREDHPEATLTGVRRAVDADGFSSYHLSYIENGVPGREQYAGGELAGGNLPPREVIRPRVAEEVRPSMTTLPSTIPATSPSGTEALD